MKKSGASSPGAVPVQRPVAAQRVGAATAVQVPALGARAHERPSVGVVPAVLAGNEDSHGRKRLQRGVVVLQPSVEPGAFVDADGVLRFVAEIDGAHLLRPRDVIPGADDQPVLGPAGGAQRLVGRDGLRDEAVVPAADVEAGHVDLPEPGRELPFLPIGIVSGVVHVVLEEGHEVRRLEEGGIPEPERRRPAAAGRLRCAEGAEHLPVVTPAARRRPRG